MFNHFGAANLKFPGDASESHDIRIQRPRRMVLPARARLRQAGPCRLFFGVRSDPFFADAEGALHGFQWTGQDTFAGKNVLSIALEVPNDMLGAGPVIGVWAAVSVRLGGMTWLIRHTAT
jgi:hypothetical protein